VEPCGARQNTTRAWCAVSPPQTGLTTAPTRPSGITTRGITSIKYEPPCPIRGSPSSTCPCARPVLRRSAGRGAGSTRRGRLIRAAHGEHTPGAAAASKMASDVRGPLVRGTGIEPALNRIAWRIGQSPSAARNSECVTRVPSKRNSCAGRRRGSMVLSACTMTPPPEGMPSPVAAPSSK
jgi:hypothetical protein